jgi:hypothetical protein
VYIIGTDPLTAFGFTFDDFVVTQNNGCEAAYTQQYSLYLSGVDVSASSPAWIQDDFDPTIPEFRIFSLDAADQGDFTLTVKSVLLMNPTNRAAET